MENKNKITNSYLIFGEKKYSRSFGSIFSLQIWDSCWWFYFCFPNIFTGITALVKNLTITTTTFDSETCIIVALAIKRMVLLYIVSWCSWCLSNYLFRWLLHSSVPRALVVQARKLQVKGKAYIHVCTYEAIYKNPYKNL